MFGSSRSGQRQRIQAYVALAVGMCVAMALLHAVTTFAERKRDVSIYGRPHKTLELLGMAQVRFLRDDRDQDGQRDFAASLEELGLANCITEELAAGEVGGYRYEVELTPAGYTFRASPLAAVGTASLYYYMDQTFQVRAQPGAPAGPESLVFYDPHEGLTGAYPAPTPTISSRATPPKETPQ